MIKKVEEQYGLWGYFGDLKDKINEIIDFVNEKTREHNSVKPLTPDEIRKTLKLKPFDEFEYEQLCSLKSREKNYISKSQAIMSRFRQTGRTTKIMCDVLSAISSGRNVLIAGTDFSRSLFLREKLVKYTKKLHLDTGLISSIIASSSETGKEKLKGLGGSIEVFWDHL